MLAITRYSYQGADKIVDAYEAQGLEGIKDQRHGNRGAPTLLSDADLLLLAQSIRADVAEGGVWDENRVQEWVKTKRSGGVESMYSDSSTVWCVRSASSKLESHAVRPIKSSALMTMHAKSPSLSRQRGAGCSRSGRRAVINLTLLPCSSVVYTPLFVSGANCVIGNGSHSSPVLAISAGQARLPRELRQVEPSRIDAEQPLEQAPVRPDLRYGVLARDQRQQRLLDCAAQVLTAVA